MNNPKLQDYVFLQDMLDDDYFPKPLVHKGQQILLNLCVSIEREAPRTLDALYALSHAATNEFNALEEEFEENDSEIETAAREAIAADFEAIAKAYGFEADTEELIATRDW
jgi:Family of unknown function (DUF5713)